MNRQEALARGALPALGCGAAAVTVHAVAFGLDPLALLAPLLLAATTATVTWAVVRRPLPPWIAGLTVALWPVVHQAPPLVALVGLLPLGTLLIGPTSRPVHGMAGGLVALAGAAAIGVTLPIVAVAAVAGAAAAWARPAHPTRGQLVQLRAGALLLPGVGLLGLLAMNLAGEQAAPLSVAHALAAGLGFAALLTLAAMALLGLVTLLETRESVQAGAWTALAGGAVGIAATVTLLDPSRSIEAVTLAAGPIAVLTAVAVLRTTGSAPARLKALWVLPIVLAVAQWGLR